MLFNLAALSLVTWTALLNVATALPQGAPATGTNTTGTLYQAISNMVPKLDLKDNNATDLTNGPCRDIYFIMARGSAEWGTLGVTMGPAICKLLRKEYGERIGCDGLQPAYTGGLLDNMLPKGTTDAAIAEGVRIFTLAHTKCPNSVLVFSGFSQGAAVIHNVVPLLSPEIKNQLAGGILIGDTRNRQSNGQIENFPKEKLLVLCTPDDGVCWGGLEVTAGHLAYVTNGDQERSAKWFKEKIDAALAAKRQTGAKKKVLFFS